MVTSGERSLSSARGVRDLSTFLRQMVSNPTAIGAVCPSSRRLSRRMVEAIAGRQPQPGVIVELGAGTGAFTRELLQSGVAARRIVALEQSPAMCDVLRERFPAVNVVNGDALELAAVFYERAIAGAGDVSAVISGIPMLALAPRWRATILQQAFELLGQRGVFVQFTYGPKVPVPRQRLRGLGLQAERQALVLRNLPPATVWRFFRGGVGGGRRRWRAAQVAGGVDGGQRR